MNNDIPQTRKHILKMTPLGHLRCFITVLARLPSWIPWIIRGDPDPPPAYDDPYPKTYAIRQIVSRPETGFYFSDTSPIALWLCLGAAGPNRNSPWFAQLNVRCKDITELMRDGFHVTEENVLWNEGKIGDTTDIYTDFDMSFVNQICESGKIRTREYVLRDTQSNPPRWTAFLQVHAETDAVLSNFRLGRISAANVHGAQAFGANGRIVYNYSALSPANSFNIIYDDMPMEGLWPWPRLD
ncbi:uncharacterized protein F4822DRAFT_421786 [Hypoxylon trugodes]|uniref:uncharacterized protein n=1 Tax=Hypoxylon trugodes TaxID=326681 RepID=UPI00219595DF|nr:uncharacterized protein F4822DRAFT_421786 [Hypoxylon trugodes]KAI1382989.1 hypothetical protein F4822DRAFT_421786 [Hypoxylon trugodes]